MGNGMNKTLRPWRDAGRQAKLLSMKQKALGKEGAIPAHVERNEIVHYNLARLM